MTTRTLRRAKWQPPPPPAPRILQLPLRSRLRQHAAAGKSAAGVDRRHNPNGKLVPLFGQGREKRDAEMNQTTEEEEIKERRGADAGGSVSIGCLDGITADKWRFQAEILRAECKFLRMEREIAIKRLGRERAFMETTLKSALHTLISVKRRSSLEGQINVNELLEDEIQDLAKRLAELHKFSTRTTDHNKTHHRPTASISSSNFDEQALSLQKQLNKFGRTFSFSSHEKTVVDPHLLLYELHSNHKCNNLTDAETLRKKMGGLSKGKLLEEMEEEYESMFSGTVTRSTENPIFTSKLYHDLLHLPSSSFQDPSQLTKVWEQRSCSGNCKAIVRRIMEQVGAETEQWSEMQEMLGQVREEMEQLRASRDYWEDRALDAEYNVQSLHSSVQDWKDKALSLEIEESQQRKQVNMLQQELERLKVESLVTADDRMNKLVPVPLEQLQEKEKRVLTCRVKLNNQINENCNEVEDSCSGRRKQQQKDGSMLALSPNRFPFRDIGNLSPSPLMKQNSRSVYPLQTRQHNVK